MNTTASQWAMAIVGLPACIVTMSCQPEVAPEASDDPPGSGQAGTTVAAQTDAEAGGPAVGAIAVCAVCHGANGEGNATLDAPRIGGMEAWYVVRQLWNFREGIRAASDEDVYGTQMRAIVMTLEGEQVIEDLAAYLESLSPEAPATTVSGDVERGRETYTVCVACHGEDGTGSEELNTPSLVDQHDGYLVRQLEHYRNGVRGSHRADEFGAQMVPIMSSLSEQDIVDVVAYINTL